MTGLPAKTALLLIDLQQAVDDPSWGHRNNLEAERAIARLLAAWRASGRSVIHVQHLSTEPGSPRRCARCRSSSPGSTTPPAAAVRVKTASTASSTACTDRKEVLSAIGRQVRPAPATRASNSVRRRWNSRRSAPWKL